MTIWIQNINGPEDLQKVPLEKLPEVAAEYRQFLIESVAKTGGHLGASLGTLELSIALHYVLSSPTDKICWDVGHQAYVHKMITGRRDRMSTLRQPKGLSGFPSPFESAHDPFIVGHAGTAISEALGLAAARDIKKRDEKVVAVVGDGAMTAGLSFEAMNNAGHLKKNMLIILNDNEMSISKNVGAMSRYLNKVITNPLYNRIRAEVDKQLQKFPRLQKLSSTSLEGMKHLFVPGILFEELGFRYFGPVDGHNVVMLVNTLRDVLKLNTCSLLHILTKKGKGCEYAEKDAEKGHGVVPFNVKTGEKIEAALRPGEATRGISYTQAFADALSKQARRNPDVVAITAAMPSGTGLLQFQKEFPERFFDVGIAEQHAITFAGALARGGLKPVCPVYSSFLQRAHDSVMHDVALQRQSMVIGIDRAGLVGADGATHQGIFDIAFLGSVPDIVLASPVDEFEMDKMMELGLGHTTVFAIRYPRVTIPKLFDAFPKHSFEIGEGEVLIEGEDVTLLALGSMVETACKAHALLKQEGISARVVNMRFAKPLDEKLILDSLQKTKMLFTLEEHVGTGGFGSRVLESLESQNVHRVPLKRFALPDEFIEHGSREAQLEEFGLSPEKITAAVLKEFHPQKK
ncbi:MAG TPA: 1-deoxy-D-xylulose-5-phosphate synthase [Candidatus Omnitrophota bacterium]|nr:1-deoxy-D-xylulose-5-phosphate synthase [Candidatus Omnitrophota bacterium]HPS37017.1 1-deoxy-D-xylulose-5-phosphate synthase [Candidatus Omnitrophota bacterium]